MFAVQIRPDENGIMSGPGPAAGPSKKLGLGGVGKTPGKKHGKGAGLSSSGAREAPLLLLPGEGPAGRADHAEEALRRVPKATQPLRLESSFLPVVWVSPWQPIFRFGLAAPARVLSARYAHRLARSGPL